MGDLFISTKTQQFKHGSDRARVTELEQRHLFSRTPLKLEVDLPCSLLPGATPPEPGRELLLCRGSGNTLGLLAGATRIGEVAGAAAQELLDAIANEPGYAGLIKVRVIEAGPFGHQVMLRCVE